MKPVLTAINAKYIHTSLAARSLAAYAKTRRIRTQIIETTINRPWEEIFSEIWKSKPDVLFFSVYIWNVDLVNRLAEEYHRLCPNVPVWAGGPEVSFETETFLQEHPYFSGIIVGEGEKTFTELCEYYMMPNKIRGLMGGIAGLVFRAPDGGIVRTALRPPLEMDQLPFCYDDSEDLKNRILYYETSRGCPFSCSYCLSSTDHDVRERSLDLVFQELQYFLDHKVSQVKFVDRTFNCRADRAYAIWNYLLEHDNGVTNFHFEIGADLFEEKQFGLLKKMRPGLVQFEIGVQTTNPETIRAVSRSMNLDRLKQAVRRIRRGRNIHQHLDLIAGLPQENAERFAQSFDEVYALRPDQLQLGFLKILKGTQLAEKAEKEGIVWHAAPPYEVMETPCLDFGSMLEIKDVESMLDVYYNSGQYTASVYLLEKCFHSAFAFYRSLAEFYRKRFPDSRKLCRMDRIECLRAFGRELADRKADAEHQAGQPAASEKKSEQPADSKHPSDRSADSEDWSGQKFCQMLDAALIYDLYLRENAKKRPHWAPDLTARKREIRRLLRRQGAEKSYVHLEPVKYRIDEWMRKGGEGWPQACREQYVLFDYEHRDPLSGNALIRLVK